MKKIILAMACISVIIFASCKKDKTEPAPVNNTPSTPAADGSVSYATQFYGIFTTFQNTTVISPTTFTSLSANAYFSNQATPYSNSASAVKVAGVYLNGDSLSYNTTYSNYSIYNNVSFATETWSVNGANGIGNFSFTNNAVTPSCTGYSTIADSISKAVGFTVSLNNVSNITSASLIVFDGTGNPNSTYSQPIVIGKNVLTVTGANLSAMATSTNGIIAVVLSNKKAFVFSGKDYQFSREAQYSKHIKIKP